LQHPFGDEQGGLTQMGAAVGTPDYISPEQARDARSADIRSDLYSLGCTFYYLLTGQAPFQGDTATEKLLHHCFDEPKAVEQLRPEAPPRVVMIVRRLMAKKPEERYQTPAKLVVALSRPGLLSTSWSKKPLTKFLVKVLGGGDPLLRPDTPERLRKAAQRRRWLRIYLAAAALLLFLLTSLGILLAVLARGGE
jgi:serine/threonine protein kinase